MSLTIPITNGENFDRQAAFVSKQLARPLRLKDYVLPAGDFTGFSIDYEGSTGLIPLRSRDWLLAGYDGIRIVGQGIDKTHLRGSWFSWTAIIERHGGVVQFEEMTIHSKDPSGGAVHFGLQNTAKVIDPRFQARYVNVKVVDDPPNADGGRTKFALFGYNADEYLKHVIIDATQGREHGDYQHGHAKWGSLWEDVEVWGAGAQPDKNRSDASETAWAGRDVWRIRRRCTFKNWYQVWSDRGGAASVAESGAANHLYEDCDFWGGKQAGAINANMRSHAVMLSAEANSYDILTGKVGVGFGNGMIAMRRCTAQGSSDVPWNNELVSIYRNGGGKTARGVLIEDCGLFGIGMIVKLGTDIPKGQTLVRGCNTNEIRQRAAARGFDVEVEATINGRPVSAGFVA